MLTFVVHCPACHALIASVRVDGDGWHEAELWAYVAAVDHRAACPAESPAAPELSTVSAELSTAPGEHGHA